MVAGKWPRRPALEHPVLVGCRTSLAEAHGDYRKGSRQEEVRRSGVVGGGVKMTRWKVEGRLNYLWGFHPLLVSISVEWGTVG